MKKTTRLVFLVLLGLWLGMSGCQGGRESPTVTPFPTPTETESITIEVNGETIVLRPGVNISPEHYAMAKDPNFVAQSEWVLDNGMWVPIPKGVNVPIDICDQDPQNPACVGLQPTSTTLPGIPEMGQMFTDPLGRFTFPFPTGWYTMTVTPDPSDGVRVMNAPSLQESTRWVTLQVLPNPHRASLRVWIAEHGTGWIGKVTKEEEGWINGVPVVRQRLENDDPNTGGPYVYALLWYPLEEYILRWTAWPGEEAETINLMERMVSSLRIP